MEDTPFFNTCGPSGACKVDHHAGLDTSIKLGPWQGFCLLGTQSGRRHPQTVEPVGGVCRGGGDGHKDRPLRDLLSAAHVRGPVGFAVQVACDIDGKRTLYGNGDADLPAVHGSFDSGPHRLSARTFRS